MAEPNNRESTIEESRRLTPTPVDDYDAAKNAISSFDLPIDDFTEMVNDLTINQLGTGVKVDGKREYILLSDLAKIYTNLQSNMKNCTFLHSTRAKRGSRIDFDKGASAVVYSIPNDDFVSYSAQIVIFNSVLEFYELPNEVDDDPRSPTYGDFVQNKKILKNKIDCFIEKANGDVRHQDVGILQDTVLRVIAIQDEVPSVTVGDTVHFQGKYYEVNDYDDITSGIITIQLRNTRNNYDNLETVVPNE